MYATLSYDVTAGPEPVAEVRQAVIDVFKDRLTCDLLADTLICGIDNTADYLGMVRKLRRIGTDFKDQFAFVFTLHRSGDPLRSNARYSRARANAIIDPVVR
jgi:hypothetical protein